MVRLLQALDAFRRLHDFTFQSHNGAIAALRPSPLVPASAMFQSHNGAIAAAELLQVACTGLRFQSHNGAIAASSKFNPHQ